MQERIALVKTGWSDEYQGGQVLGRYAHIEQFDEAHERFNFRHAADGRYYGYLPPIGKQLRPPMIPAQCVPCPTDWSVFGTFSTETFGVKPETVVVPGLEGCRNWR